jgi:formate-dependent nitrite reductase membrane component NrfD
MNSVRLLLAGIAAGLMFAVLYLRNSGASSNSLDELGDSALVLVVIGAVISLLADRQRRAQER